MDFAPDEVNDEGCVGLMRQRVVMRRRRNVSIRVVKAAAMVKSRMSFHEKACGRTGGVQKQLCIWATRGKLNGRKKGHTATHSV